MKDVSSVSVEGETGRTHYSTEVQVVRSDLCPRGRLWGVRETVGSDHGRYRGRRSARFEDSIPSVWPEGRLRVVSGGKTEILNHDWRQGAWPIDDDTSTDKSPVTEVFFSRDWWFWVDSQRRWRKVGSWIMGRPSDRGHRGEGRRTYILCVEYDHTTDSSVCPSSTV